MERWFRGAWNGVVCRFGVAGVAPAVNVVVVALGGLRAAAGDVDVDEYSDVEEAVDVFVDVVVEEDGHVHVVLGGAGAVLVAGDAVGAVVDAVAGDDGADSDADAALDGAAAAAGPENDAGDGAWVHETVLDAC